MLKDQISVIDNSNREGLSFSKEAAVHKFFQSDNKDYAGSGYDRGHLAAAANHRHSQDAMESTFTLANCSPQHPSLNRGIWKQLESYVRSMAQHNDHVFCLSGPMYVPFSTPEGKKFVNYECLGDNNVAIPTHFFKAIAIGRKDGKYRGQIPYI